METIDRFKAEYIDYHGLTADRSARQIKALQEFEAHAGKPLTECGAEEFRSYLAHLTGTDLHPNTVAQRAGMIRPYFGWAFDSALISGDVLMAVQRVGDPKGSSKRTKPKPYSTKELRRFWDDIDTAWPLKSERSLKMWRNGTATHRVVWRHLMHVQIEAIVRLALDCGLRRQEIYGLSIDDMHPDNFYIVVRMAKREAGGAEKMREVPFTKATRVAVERWLAFRTEMKPDHDFPWLALRNPVASKPMRWARFAGIVGTCGPYTLHRFRHTCATLWLRSGVALEKVQRMLGHATLEQTLAYAELNRDDIHAAMHKNEDVFEKLANAEEAHTDERDD